MASSAILLPLGVRRTTFTFTYVKANALVSRTYKTCLYCVLRVSSRAESSRFVLRADNTLGSAAQVQLRCPLLQRVYQLSEHTNQLNHCQAVKMLPQTLSEIIHENPGGIFEDLIVDLLAMLRSSSLALRFHHARNWCD